MPSLNITSLFINANRLKAAAKRRRLSRRLATPARTRRRRLQADPWKFCHLTFSCKLGAKIKSGRVPAIRELLRLLNNSLPESDRLPKGLWNDRSSPLFCLCGGKRLHVVFIGPGRKVETLHNRREQIQQMLAQVLQVELFQFFDKLAPCRAELRETEYLITNLVLAKPASEPPKLPNDIIPYVEALLQRDFRRHLQSFGAPQQVLEALSVSILRLEDRPRRLDLDSGDVSIMLPRLVVRSNTDIAGPFFAGYLNNVGYGRIAKTGNRTCQ